MGKIVTFGEIMLRLMPPGLQRLRRARSFDAVYGGGEANVAVSLANYGEGVQFVTRLPENDLGDACVAFLHQYGVGTKHPHLYQRPAMVFGFQPGLFCLSARSLVCSIGGTDLGQFAGAPRRDR